MGRWRKTSLALVSFFHLVAMMSLGAVPFSTQAIIARTISWCASRYPGVLYVPVLMVAAWSGPAKYHGAFTSSGVDRQCLLFLESSVQCSVWLSKASMISDLLHPGNKEQTIKVVHVNSLGLHGTGGLIVVVNTGIRGDVSVGHSVVV